MVHHIYYIKFALQFADMQIGELVSEFNNQAGLRAWSSMRAYQNRALIDEFKNRGIDISAISDNHSISFKHKVYYDFQNNKLVPIVFS